MEQQQIRELESISLEYTAKGLANWVIRLKSDLLTAKDIDRLVELDKLLKTKFPVNVTSQ